MEKNIKMNACIYVYWRRQWHSLQYSCLENPMGGGTWWAAVHGVVKSRTRLSDFTFTFHFDALEKEMATHSSILAWRIRGTGELDGLPSMGSHRVRHDWSDLAAAAATGHSQYCTSCHPCLVPTHFHHPQRKLCTHKAVDSIPFSLSLERINLHSFCISLPILDIVCEQNQTIGNLLCLAAFV